MCGRYRNKMSWDQLRRLMELAIPDASAAPNMEPNLDIRPTTSQWVIRPTPAGNEATRLRWGLVPYWHGGKPLKDFKLTTFNAKAETVATAATFKGPFARRRCLVPAHGWYEWTGPKGSKQRWTFTAKDGEPITFGGIWDRCETSDQGVVESFTIITQPAGAPLNGYHDRAPAVIWAEDRERWMTPGAEVTDLLGPESVDRFDVRPSDEADLQQTRL